MSVSPIGSIATPEALINAGSVRLERVTAAKELPTEPASALAVGVDTARIMVNQAAFSPAMMAPTAGVFTVGATSVRVGTAVSSIASSSGFSSWGF